MIVDNRGQVVWFRPLRHPIKQSSRAMNFEVQTYWGRPVLTWGETPGEYVVFDDSYRKIVRLEAANGYSGDHHEYLISPQDTALITIYDAVPRDLSYFGGPKNGVVVVQGIVQELDIETGEVLIEWHSLEHVGLEETYGRPGEDKNYPGIDYFHINSRSVRGRAGQGPFGTWARHLQGRRADKLSAIIQLQSHDICCSTSITRCGDLVSFM